MRKQLAGLFGATSIATAALVSGAMAADAAVTAAPSAATAAPSTNKAAPSTATVAARSSVGGKISRKEVISRAKYWYTHRAHIRYNMYGSYRDPQGRKYRTDCSGYASMALHLGTSASTVSLTGYSKAISRGSMKAGDLWGIMGAGTGGSGGHVRIFEKWANKAHTKYWAYDFGSTPVKHAIHSFSADKPRNGHHYAARRYKKIV